MERGIVLPREFSDRVKTAAKLLNRKTFARVISHYDADGITAASVMISSLKREGMDFHLTINKSLDEEMVERLATENNELTIFLDMGSGQIEPLEMMPGDVLVLDHHKPVRDSKKVLQINPHFWGLDGMREVSASGLALILAVALNEKNWIMSPIAVTGLVGDMQHLGGFSALNRSILDEAVRRGLMSTQNDLRIGGANLLDAIAGSIIPYFRGLSGRKDPVREFLESAGFDPDSDIQTIEESDRRRLLSLLITRLLSQGCENDVIEQLYGETLTVSSDSLRGLRIDDLTELINACGRTDHPGVGVAACLGDSGALKEAIRFRSDYDSSLLSALRAIEEGGHESMEWLQVIRPAKVSLAGAVCGISMQYLLNPSKPTIAISRIEGAIRVSARGTHALVARGLDLATSMREASTPLGGTGGGHSVAAGATVPLAREKEFLQRVNEITGSQIGNTKRES